MCATECSSGIAIPPRAPTPNPPDHNEIICAKSCSPNRIAPRLSLHLWFSNKGAGSLQLRPITWISAVVVADSRLLNRTYA